MEHENIFEWQARIKRRAKDRKRYHKKKAETERKLKAEICEVYGIKPDLLDKIWDTIRSGYVRYNG